MLPAIQKTLSLIGKQSTITCTLEVKFDSRQVVGNNLSYIATDRTEQTCVCNICVELLEGCVQDFSLGAKTKEPKIKTEGREHGWGFGGGGSKPFLISYGI